MIRKFILVALLFFGLQTTTAFAEQQIPPAYTAEAVRHDLPPIVVYALALCESGKKTANGYRPWPWTLNVEGEGYYFDTKEQALAIAQNAINQNASIDIGLMQVNWKHHKHRFDEKVADALDPYNNLQKGVLILRQYTNETGSLWKGIGRYHSRTPALAETHRARCLKILVNQLENQ